MGMGTVLGGYGYSTGWVWVQYGVDMGTVRGGELTCRHHTHTLYFPPDGGTCHGGLDATRRAQALSSPHSII